MNRIQNMDLSSPDAFNEKNKDEVDEENEFQKEIEKIEKNKDLREEKEKELDNFMDPNYKFDKEVASQKEINEKYQDIFKGAWDKKKLPPSKKKKKGKDSLKKTD